MDNNTDYDTDWKYNSIN